MRALSNIVLVIVVAAAITHCTINPYPSMSFGHSFPTWLR